MSEKSNILDLSGKPIVSGMDEGKSIIPDNAFIADVKVPTIADKLRDIAMAVRNRSLAERYACDAIDKAKELAESGHLSYQDKIFTREFFKANKQAMAIPQGEDADEYLEKLYLAQKESYALMAKEGFKITYTDLELPSTLDINMDAQTRQLVEQTKRFTESMVTVSWE